MGGRKRERDVLDDSDASSASQASSSLASASGGRSDSGASASSSSNDARAQRAVRIASRPGDAKRAAVRAAAARRDSGSDESSSDGERGRAAAAAGTGKKDASAAGAADASDEDKPASGFARAMLNVLGGDTEAKIRAPIMAKNRQADERLAAEKAARRAARERKLEKRAKLERGHDAPESATDPTEKRLKKVAIRGVVQLFNAVRKHQRVAETVEDEARMPAATVDALSKDAFLDLLKSGKADGGSARKAAAGEPSMKRADGDKDIMRQPAWADDNFMMDAKLKDWDQAGSDDDGAPKYSQAGGGDDSDSS